MDGPCAQFWLFTAQFLHSGSFCTKKKGRSGATLKILQTRGLGICQRPKGEKNTAGNHDLGWLTEISQRAETIQIISTTTFAQCGNYFFTKVSSIKTLNSTDKRTDFMIWRINFELWAVAWAGLWEKRVWADYEQLLRPDFSLFRGQKKLKILFF